MRVWSAADGGVAAAGGAGAAERPRSPQASAWEWEWGERRQHSAPPAALVPARPDSRPDLAAAAPGRGAAGLAGRFWPSARSTLARYAAMGVWK
eukprot:gene17628-8503_t